MARTRENCLSLDTLFKKKVSITISGQNTRASTNNTPKAIDRNKTACKDNNKERSIIRDHRVRAAKNFEYIKKRQDIINLSDNCNIRNSEFTLVHKKAKETNKKLIIPTKGSFYSMKRSRRNSVESKPLNINKRFKDSNLLPVNHPIIFNHFADDCKRLIKRNIEHFKTNSEPPKTTTEYYALLKLIGKGAFGKVVLGIHKLTGKYVAIKEIEKKYIQDEFSQHKVFQEIYILKKIRHAHVIRLLEVFEDSSKIFIVMENASGGDLLKYVRNHGMIPENKAREFFRQIVYGLGHIHARSVLHRDVKLDNILLDLEGNVKICDFGISKMISKHDFIKEQCGTPAYIAPEIISNKGYGGFYADYWSLGVLLYAMLTVDVPFKANSLEQLLAVILQKKITFPSTISNNAKNLISSLLKINPMERSSIPEILLHPWLNEDNETLYKEKDKFIKAVEEEEDEVSNINRININNLFYKKDEKLLYEDYQVIINDMYTYKIDEEILKKMEKLGYPRHIVIDGIQKGLLNHATATYNVLEIGRAS